MKELMGQALAEGHSAQETLQEGLMSNMAVIGNSFKNNEAFVRITHEGNCNIICCFALLTTIMVVMADVVKIVKFADLKGKLRGTIGGAPITQIFYNEIGANACTPDTAFATDKAAAFCIGG